jgi:hypothetical protein
VGLFDALAFKVGFDASEVDKGLKGIESKANSVAGSVGRSFQTAGVIIAGATTAAGLLGVAVIKTASEFEKAESRLQTFTGSAESAQARMEELFTFAQNTPFSLESIVDAEVILQSFGAATQENLVRVADFAGAMGVDLAQAAMDVGRAMSQGAGALESDAGRALRGMIEARTGVKATEMSLRDFREALTETLDADFEGGAARLATTFGGVINNLEDQWTRFKKDIADSGLFEGVKAGAAELLLIMGDNEEALKAIADEIGIGLLAGLQLSITAVGFLVDGFHIGRGAVIGMRGAILEMDIAAQEAYLSLLKATDQLPGVDNTAERLFAVNQLNEATAAMARLDEEALAVANSIGQGAATAEQLNAAIDAGRSTGRSTGATGDLDGTAPKAPGTGTGQEGADDISDSQAADDRDAANAEEQRILAEHQGIMLDIEKAAAEERARIAQKEYDRRASLATDGMSLINSIVSDANDMRVRDDLSTADKVIAIALRGAARLLGILAARLATEGIANIAAQNYAKGAAQLGGAALAGAGAGALASEASSIESGDASVGGGAAGEIDEASTRKGVFDNREESSGFEVLDRAATKLESAAESLERAARNMGTGGTGLPLLDLTAALVGGDALGNGALRRAARGARGAFGLRPGLSGA